MVAAPLAAGIYARRLRPFERFSRLLLVVGVVSFVTTLAESDDATLYSLGRAAGWTLELLLVVLVLAFPDGPLRGRPDRLLAAAMAAVVAVFYFPTLILTEHFQVPSPYTSCTHDCPDNVFFPFGTDHPAVGRAFLGAGALLVFIIMLLVLVRLRARIGHASAIQRQALLPVLVLGAVREALVGVLIVTRQLDGDDGLRPDRRDADRLGDARDRDRVPGGVGPDAAGRRALAAHADGRRARDAGPARAAPRGRRARSTTRRWC